MPLSGPYEYSGSSSYPAPWRIPSGPPTFDNLCHYRAGVAISPRLLLLSSSQPIINHPVAFGFSSPLVPALFDTSNTPSNEFDHTDLSIIDFDTNPCDTTDTTFSDLSYTRTSSYGATTQTAPPADTTSSPNLYVPRLTAATPRTPRQIAIGQPLFPIDSMYQTPESQTISLNGTEPESPAPESPCDRRGSAAHFEDPTYEFKREEDVKFLSENESDADEEFVPGKGRKRSYSKRKPTKRRKKTSEVGFGESEKLTKPDLKCYTETDNLYFMIERSGSVLQPLRARRCDKPRQQLVTESPALQKSISQTIRGLVSCGHSCGEKFSSCESMVQHLDSTHERDYRPYLCPDNTCVWSVLGFHKKSECMRHYRSQHCGPIYICAVQNCGKRFLRSDSCHRHIRMSHLNPGSRFNRLDAD